MSTAVDISHASRVTIGSITSSGADATLSIAHSRGIKVGNIDSSDKKAVTISQSESVSVDVISRKHG